MPEATISTPPTPEAKADDRPLRNADLNALREKAVTVTLRAGYSFPQGKDEAPLTAKGPITIPLRRAIQHVWKFDEDADIRQKWKEIEREQDHRDAAQGRNVAAGAR